MACRHKWERKEVRKTTMGETLVDVCMKCLTGREVVTKGGKIVVIYYSDLIPKTNDTGYWWEFKKKIWHDKSL